jgi:hypothetical protein
MSDNGDMLPDQWYELAGWTAEPPMHHAGPDTQTIAIDYNDPSRDSLVSVVTLRKRPGQPDTGGGHTLPTSITEARLSAILSALSAVSPNSWPASPYSPAEFKALVDRFVPKATEPAGWHPAELRIDDEARAAETYELPHGARAIAMDGGAYFLAIGGRNLRLNELALVLAG